MFAAVTVSAHLHICIHSILLVEERRGEECNVFTISGSFDS